MSYGIGEKVSVTQLLYLGRWIYPYEVGFIQARDCSPAGQETYKVKLEDGKEYTFAPGEIEGENGKD